MQVSWNMMSISCTILCDVEIARLRAEGGWLFTFGDEDGSENQHKVESITWKTDIPCSDATSSHFMGANL